MHRGRGAGLGLAAGVLAMTACGGESNSPSDPIGQIRVATSTTGLSVDPDGYTVALDGGAGQPIQGNATLLLQQVVPGNHTLGLAGVANNCRIQEQQPLTVLVNAGETTEASFTITCSESRRLAFAYRTPDEGYDDIWVINADGSGRTRLTRGLGAVSPRWSPDGSKIAYMPTGETYPFERGIGVMNADGTNPITVWEESDGNYYEVLGVPSWSPDSRRLVFAGRGSAADGGWIATIQADGSNFQGLTNDEWSWSPAWSPDGGRIAFVLYDIWSGNTGYWVNSSIRTMSPDGTGVTILTGGSGRFDDPAWSPDGTAIVYRAGGALRIFPLDGSPPPHPGDQLVEGGSYPAWSPDGSMIAYEAPEGVYLVRPDGTGKRFLTPGARPTWAPLAAGQ